LALDVSGRGGLGPGYGWDAALFPQRIAECFGAQRLPVEQLQ